MPPGHSHSDGVLDDLLRPGLNLVICGTQAGEQSKKEQRYYAKAGNRFWGILFDVGLTPACLRNAPHAELLDCGIGLTDLAKWSSGTDKKLKPEHIDRPRFIDRMQRISPRVIAFNGKRAAALFFNLRTSKLDYGMSNRKVGGSDVFVLPSTSGAASRYWSVGPWLACAEYVRGLP